MLQDMTSSSSHRAPTPSGSHLHHNAPHAAAQSSANQYAPSMFSSSSLLAPSQVATTSIYSRALTTPSPPPGSEIYLTPPHSPPTPHHLYHNASSDVNASPQNNCMENNKLMGTSKNNLPTITTSRYSNGLTDNSLNSGLGRFVTSSSQPLNTNLLTPIPRSYHSNLLEPERIDNPVSTTNLPSRTNSTFHSQPLNKTSHSMSTQSFQNSTYLTSQNQNSISPTKNKENNLYSNSSTSSPIPNKNNHYSSTSNQTLFSSPNNLVLSKGQYQHIMDIPYPR